MLIELVAVTQVAPQLVGPSKQRWATDVSQSDTRSLHTISQGRLLAQIVALAWWLVNQVITCCNMRALSVCVLLCSAAVLASAVKSGPAMFADWLAEQTTAAAPSSTAKSAAAPAYEEADYEWGCLRETRLENCRCIGCSDPCTDAGAVCDDDTRPCCATTYAE